jgi:uncharacterized RDD family membrane protein YckC
MVDRRDWAGWLQGPRKSLESQGIELGHPGQRLGLPLTGPGSIARFGRRLVALVVDWISALVLARAVIDLAGVKLELDLLTLLLFFGHTWLFITFFGGSFGHRLLGIQIQQLNGSRISILQAAIRQFLVCLVVPAVIYDRDQRSLHDRAIKAIAVRA